MNYTMIHFTEKLFDNEMTYKLTGLMSRKWDYDSARDSKFSMLLNVISKAQAHHKTVRPTIQSKYVLPV